ncbi:MAG TPA: ABC transporter permease [Candidatus Polarisedimenticolia bacterium]|nr:ABC transporter permease [Candidatus Polarisedimenticolia bacterium]
MKSLWQDVRYGFRLLVHQPGFTTAAILTLGLGIGANTALFSVIHAVLLKPLPYADADRIMMVWSNNLSKGWDSFAVSPPDFLDFKKRSRRFETMVAFQSESLVLTGDAEPERLDGMLTTEGFFELSGVQPARGRGFRPEEFGEGKNRVVVLSHGLWKRRFGSNPEVLQKSLLLNGEPYAVVGVLPEQFRIPMGADLLAPLGFSDERLAHRGSRNLVVMGKLRPGGTVSGARAEVSGIAESLAKQYPDADTGWGATVNPLYEQIVGGVRPALVALFAAVGFVLLIACGNVTNLLLAHGSSRQKEIALRAAVGAGQGRLVRQLLTESVLLALGGGGLGLLLGGWGVDLLRALKPAGLPRIQELGMNPTVLLFTLGLSLLTGLVVGVTPAFLISRSNLHDVLKEGGRGPSRLRQRLRGLLVVSQVALSLVLLVGAGLQIRSFMQLMAVNPGFDATNALTFRVSLPGQKYAAGEPRSDFYRRTLESARALPGVKAVAAVNPLPFGGDDLIYSVEVEGRPSPAGQNPSANWYSISSDYLQTMGIPIVKGRGFTEHDAPGAPRVALINETMARKVFPGEDPIGRRISMGIDPESMREIVGIVRDVKHYGLESQVTMQMYEPFLQNPSEGMTFVLRSDANPGSLAPAARRAVFALDRDLPVSQVQTLESLISDSSSQRRFNTVLIGLFALVALVLAAVGIYGVVAYSVAQRTQELGVRMALGAQKSHIFGMVLRQAMGLVTSGVIVGLAGAALLIRFIAHLLYGVGPFDAMTFFVTPLILAAVALLASYLPARRATRVDPAVALRCE